MAAEESLNTELLEKLYKIAKESPDLPMELLDKGIKQKILEVAELKFREFSDADFGPEMHVSFSTTNEKNLVFVREHDFGEGKVLSKETVEDEGSDTLQITTYRSRSGYLYMFIEVNRYGKIVNYGGGNRQNQIPWKTKHIKSVFTTP